LTLGVYIRQEMSEGFPWEIMIVVHSVTLFTFFPMEQVYIGKEIY